MSGSLWPLTPKAPRSYVAHKKTSLRTSQDAAPFVIHSRSAAVRATLSSAKPAAPTPSTASVHGLVASRTLGQKLFLVCLYSANSWALAGLAWA